MLARNSIYAYYTAVGKVSDTRNRLRFIFAPPTLPTSGSLAQIESLASFSVLFKTESSIFRLADELPTLCEASIMSTLVIFVLQYALQMLSRVEMSNTRKNLSKPTHARYPFPPDLLTSNERTLPVGPTKLPFTARFSSEYDVILP